MRIDTITIVLSTLIPCKFLEVRLTMMLRNRCKQYPRLEHSNQHSPSVGFLYFVLKQLQVFKMRGTHLLPAIYEQQKGFHHVLWGRINISHDCIWLNSCLWVMCSKFPYFQKPKLHELASTFPFTLHWLCISQPNLHTFVSPYATVIFVS